MKTLQKLQKTFATDEGIQKILNQMSKEITDLTKWQPTIEILANQSLKDRHWDEIKKLTKSAFNHKTISLNLWFNLGVPPQTLANVGEISDKAKKQSRLEDMLISMENEWKMN